MRFKVVGNDTEIVEAFSLDITAEEMLKTFISRHPELNCSLDPNVTTFTSRGIINQDKDTLKKKLSELRIKANSIIMIEDKRGVELALYFY